MNISSFKEGQVIENQPRMSSLVHANTKSNFGSFWRKADHSEKNRQKKKTGEKNYEFTVNTIFLENVQLLRFQELQNIF